MKNLKFLLFALAVLLTFHASAQTERRTSGAKAAYGHEIVKIKHKDKKQKVNIAKHHRPASGTRSSAWATRKKFRAIYMS